MILKSANENDPSWIELFRRIRQIDCIVLVDDVRECGPEERKRIREELARENRESKENKA